MNSNTKELMHQNVILNYLTTIMMEIFSFLNEQGITASKVLPN